ncbi:MAG: primosomal protein N' [Thermoguttaceae bacterium]|nr:primosomal protein N' [Thermoguttaceae bacterium]MDW8038448.1 primosomal protein N' [Thermoguttaceae bacterium]
MARPSRPEKLSDQLPGLFDLLPPWEEDDRAEVLVAKVVFPDGPSGDFDYLVPACLAGRVQPGQRVRVPLGKGNRLAVGYCVEVGSRPVGQRQLKPIGQLVDERPLLSPAMLRLTQWMADYYLCDWATVLETVLPAGVRHRAGLRLTTFWELNQEALAKLDLATLPPKQRLVVQILREAKEPLTAPEIQRVAKCSAGPITALHRKGLLKGRRVRIRRQDILEPPEPRQPNLPLNPDQQKALEIIRQVIHSGQHKTILLYGVTGSGKTEVYIQAIQEVLRFGRQAIVLVPEISLTPQTLQRFRARFDSVAVLHSHLTDAERHWQWERIASGKVQVVIGARSAVFAPVPHLGIIVLDEEHEASFKQQQTPRYHAREVALWRAAAEGVPLILGSATPSLETWYQAQQGHYLLVQLPRRIEDRPLPPVSTIDLRIENSGKKPLAISRPLYAAMRESLREGGQIILLLNRRGFSTHIQCPACGYVLKCPLCDIALTHHRTQQIALCHYCDYHEPAPTACPHCQFLGILYRGLGTQRLEVEVRSRFSGVPCLRMDTDSMQARGAYDRALEAFRTGKVRILLGTQMIAKGLDFPEVTLVGVVNADTALHLPDFRASERTFQLVTQVAGRTGRGPKGGRVLVQTFNPDHPIIQAAIRHDYVRFAQMELANRKAFGYPPFTRMIRLVVRGLRPEPTAEFAKLLAERVREQLGLVQPPAGPQMPTRVLGPAPAPFAKLRGMYRYHLLLQSSDGDQLRQAVRRATADLQVPENIQWIADVDPIEML